MYTAKTEMYHSLETFDVVGIKDFTFQSKKLNKYLVEITVCSPYPFNLEVKSLRTGVVSIHRGIHDSVGKRKAALKEIVALRDHWKMHCITSSERVYGISEAIDILTKAGFYDEKEGGEE